MSAFQYYEFRTINRQLSPEERKTVNGYSSRGRVTSNRAVFTYSYSGFRYDEKQVLLDHFDYHLYFSSWDTRRLMFRIPKAGFDYALARDYCRFPAEGYFVNSISIEPAGDCYLVILAEEPEEGYGESYWYEEDEDYSTDLPGIFHELLRGDFRSLFIFWLLHLMWMEEKVPTDLTLPLQFIPPGLGQLTAPQKALANFFGVESAWIKAAARYSEPLATEEEGYERLISRLPPAEKDGYLLSLLRQEPGVEIKLLQRLHDFTERPPERTGEVLVSELVEEVMRQRNREKAAEAAAAEQARLAALRETAKNREAIHREIEYRLKTKSKTSYDAIVARIQELGALARHEGREREFRDWLEAFRVASGPGRPSLLRRLGDRRLKW